MQAFKCLTGCLTGCLTADSVRHLAEKSFKINGVKCLTVLAENTPKNTRHLVRHFSDTCRNNQAKTKAYRCLTRCLTVSDRSKITGVCLGECPVGTPPTPDMPDSFQEVMK